MSLARHRTVLTAYAIALLLFAVGTLHSLDFAAPSQLKTMLVYASFIGIIGLGQTLCILTGGIDLSVPWTLTGAAVLTSVMTAEGRPLGVAIALVLALALVVGLLNGIGVAYAGVPPIIMTLGMNGALQGLLLVYTDGGISANPPQGLTDFVLGDTLGLPTQLWIWAAVIALGCALLSLTTFGRRLYAIGANRRAAELAGVRARRVLVAPYVISALGAAVTGLLVMGFTGQAFLTMGDPYLFSSAVAVAVGGASILGGSGHYAGTVAGALVLTLVASLLPLFSLGTAWLQIAYGLILLAAVYAAGLNVTRKKRGSPDA
ncbi:ABC transporter permease [Conexibacter stalactiti]|uniref:Autoinducer 2 import system permease protein LsrC n=1 Tax=Conexibacter stalactiti TaxID=1940611 RepID=A0ABU4HUM2_9ACTN|nr:ABC transporter permease [Conexibacter stalactiti]MDW5596940.1 ABC transporter permease [Conexibacter stalactiti]MEC5037582.1 ABC transporter permease [Conexibacter stalactiti]